MTPRGFGFRDILDIVNPLQHLPIIGSVYRWLTGDRPGAVAQIAGDALYGGPIGAAVGFVEHRGRGNSRAAISANASLPRCSARMTRGHRRRRRDRARRIRDAGDGRERRPLPAAPPPPRRRRAPTMRRCRSSAASPSRCPPSPPRPLLVADAGAAVPGAERPAPSGRPRPHRAAAGSQPTTIGAARRCRRARCRRVPPPRSGRRRIRRRRSISRRKCWMRSTSIMRLEKRARSRRVEAQPDTPALDLAL